MKYLRASVKEVLEWAEKAKFFLLFNCKTVFIQKKITQNYINHRNQRTQNVNLKIIYIKEVFQVVYPLIKKCNSKLEIKIFMLSVLKIFSGGWELRNLFYKGSLLKKDISILNLNNENHNQNHNQNETGKRAAVFEGFMDALSFC